MEGDMGRLRARSGSGERRRGGDCKVGAGVRERGDEQCEAAVVGGSTAISTKAGCEEGRRWGRREKRTAASSSSISSSIEREGKEIDQKKTSAADELPPGGDHAPSHRVRLPALSNSRLADATRRVSGIRRGSHDGGATQGVAKQAQPELVNLSFFPTTTVLPVSLGSRWDAHPGVIGRGRWCNRWWSNGYLRRITTTLPRTQAGRGGEEGGIGKGERGAGYRPWTASWRVQATRTVVYTTILSGSSFTAPPVHLPPATVRRRSRRRKCTGGDSESERRKKYKRIAGGLVLAVYATTRVVRATHMLFPLLRPLFYPNADAHRQRSAYLARTASARPRPTFASAPTTRAACPSPVPAHPHPHHQSLLKLCAQTVRGGAGGIGDGKERETRILQPAMYRHVNLRSFACAISFFTTVSGNTDRHRRLAESVQTLQFSFDLDGDPDNDELDSVPESDSEEELSCEEDPAAQTDTQADPDEEDMDSDDEPVDFVDIPVPEHPLVVEFWARFQEALPKLIQLDVFSVSFDHYDPFFLRRLLTYGNLADTLPSSVDKLHLKPLPSQYTLAEEDLVLDCFAWDLTPWRLDISLIPHIRSLFVTTPSYVVWPPTKRQLKFSMDSWTAQLRRGSNSDLREIVINSGFGDNGESIDWFERKKLKQHPEFQLLDVFDRMRTLGGGLGVQLVWRRSRLRGSIGEHIWRLVRIHVLELQFC
ncbi:hypothetical protein DFH06DRAFT_1142062 [Mycena polygramma]|nr:hypothetical protein DFH06DRAFT_1142062 [Mycena polygramma]